jgi:lipoate-protein ligase A
MKYLDLTLETAALNLACDEALIDWCEGTGNLEVLRIWEPRQAFVVLGYANRAAVEADLEGSTTRERRSAGCRRFFGEGAQRASRRRSGRAR